MPIYEYSCAACHAPTEIIQKASDPGPESCEKCGKGPMVKQVSLSAFSLKGSGWYVTDFKGGSAAKPAAEGANPDAAPKPDKAPEKSGGTT